MRTIKFKKMMPLILTVIISIFYSENILAQQFKLDNAKSALTVYGTSSLHDWEIKAQKQSGIVALQKEENLTLTQLEVSIEAESLKSYKTAMDKNTYKALKTDQHKFITFKLVQVKKMEDLGNSVYRVTASGKLTIAGVAKTTDLTFKMQMSSNAVTLEGEKTFNMTEYDIKPPTALLGTVKTGDQITIKFKTILTN
ncbi:MAG TPA: YceI family protein [Flavobacteriaceae bacterium]|nr:YceI family protein [Flavobacteriaceae bacterium]